jgi:hypothetical protein
MSPRNVVRRKDGFLSPKSRRRTMRQCVFKSLTFFSFLLAWRALLLNVSNDDSMDEENKYIADIIPTTPKLRLDWTNVPLSSEMSKRIHAQMTNCSLPLGTFRMRNRMGLGSDLHVWSQVLCNAMDENVRVYSMLPWQWRDEEKCQDENESSPSALSSLDCYFDSAELQCKDDVSIIYVNETLLHEISSPYTSKCPSILGDNATMEETASFRAAAMEYLFSHVSPIVVQEAQRQLQLVFPGGTVPPNLITVQIRWGDKQKEMKLLPAHDYIKGVQEILQQRNDDNDDSVSIYLATEDPKAVKAFRQAAPKEWNIYIDQYYHDMLPLRHKGKDVYNQGPKTARATKGRAGLVALGSLLVAMEANDFVLTTASNWSRLMNELRKNVLDPRCNGCTRMVDLKYGEW